MSRKEQRAARIVGALFLVAMVASLVGAGLIEAVLAAPDVMASAHADRTQVALGVLLELINAVAVVGIAVGMFPLFKKENEALALGYIALRIIEAVIIIAAVISPLALIALGQANSTAAADAASFQTMGASLVAVRAVLVGQLTGIFFGLAALLFYYLLYQSRIVPRFISIWGLVAVVLVLAWNISELVGLEVSIGMILVLPIILNEIFLGIWLIVKGFDPAPAVAVPTQTAMTGVGG